jgi:hypothetical protein
MSVSGGSNLARRSNLPRPPSAAARGFIQGDDLMSRENVDPSEDTGASNVDPSEDTGTANVDPSEGPSSNLVDPSEGPTGARVDPSESPGGGD